MSGKRHQNEDANEAKKSRSHDDQKFLLEKRLIWQHLAQKKIKKTLKVRLKISGNDK